MKKKILVTLLISTMLLTFTACGGNDDSSSEDTTQEDTQAEDTTDDSDSDADAEAAPTYENFEVDEDAKTITFEGTVNGTYFTEPTKHAIVSETGGNAEKAMITTKANNVDINDALEAMGVKGDTNVSMDDMSSTVADNVVNTGDALEFYISWDGQEEIPFNEVIASPADFDWNVVFTGNHDVAEETQAGCVLCLDSCAAGVCVNALPVGTSSDPATQFTLDNSKGIEDGANVTITIKVAD
ncbi:MAG: YdjY domain-containing protein [Suipraeoptans sp.]